MLISLLLVNVVYAGGAEPKPIPIGCPGSVDKKESRSNNAKGVPCPNGGSLDADGNFVPKKETECGTPGIREASYLCDGDNDIADWANYIANWLVGLISLVAVLMIIISGVQMISSAGNPEAIKAARGRLLNAVIGLVTLIAMRLILGIIGVL